MSEKIFRGSQFVLLCIVLFQFMTAATSKYFCGCLYATSCTLSSPTSCCPGLSCRKVDNFGNTQCLENSAYTSLTSCVHTNQNGCSRSSDCCNPAAVCTTYRNCILNHTCTNYYVSPEPSSQPTTHPTMQPLRKPLAHPTSQPRSKPSSQPMLHPIVHPTSQPVEKPSRKPSNQPLLKPVCRPSKKPTQQPTLQPQKHPAGIPTNQPSNKPYQLPTKQPSRCPNQRPSSKPSFQPYHVPSSLPSDQPVHHPTRQPVSRPSFIPIVHPVAAPSKQPINRPTFQPFNRPISVPSVMPTTKPRHLPSSGPSKQPQGRPTYQPNERPIAFPSPRPSMLPMLLPTRSPSHQPTSVPSKQSSRTPTNQPSDRPYASPSLQPTNIPTNIPSGPPTQKPLNQPSFHPTAQPMTKPKQRPSAVPSEQPSRLPTGQPFSLPSNVPTLQSNSLPTSKPSQIPTQPPSTSPSCQPTNFPMSAPTHFPTNQPVRNPSQIPNSVPSRIPSTSPSQNPSPNPSKHPTSNPTQSPFDRPSAHPSSQSSVQPSRNPFSQPTIHPSVQPNSSPSKFPSTQPFSAPSLKPSSLPTKVPRSKPSSQPTVVPLHLPTCQPRRHPSNQPSKQPLKHPSRQPNSNPSYSPTNQPSTNPSHYPKVCPTFQPSVQPSVQPSGQPTVQPPGFKSSFIVVNITSSAFSTAERKAFISTVATILSLDVSHIYLDSVMYTTPQAATMQSGITIPHTIIRAPLYLFPQFGGNFTTVQIFLTAKLEDSVFSGAATILLRRYLAAEGLDEVSLPAIVAVFSGDIVLMPTPAPTTVTESLSHDKTGTGAANSPLVIGLVAGIAFFLFFLSPLAFIITRKYREQQKELGKSELSHDLSGSTSTDNDSGKEDLNLDPRGKEHANAVDAPAVANFHLGDCYTTKDDFEKEKQKFATHHSMYANGATETVEEEDDKDSEVDSFELPEDLAVPVAAEDLLKAPVQGSMKKEKTGFFKFGTDAVIVNQTSFDISDFYPRSMSFDVEFAAAMNGMTFFSGEKEARASKFPTISVSPSHDEVIPSSKSLKAMEKDKGECLLVPASNNSSPARSPNSKGADRLGKDTEEEVAKNAAESTSPHSAQFKAIRNKFQTMIEKNNKALTLAPLSLPNSPNKNNNNSNSNSPSPRPSHQRRFSDGQSAGNKVD